MCGISGIVSFNEQSADWLSRIHAANDCLSQRGPDSEGFFIDDKIALGHRRLSIIDTSTAANQPMYDATGRYVIIFNGEFFNFQEHRSALIEKGHQFRTTSDTEVLLQLYILEGPKCLEKVNGFFAFAIYDKKEKSVFIARDRMGIKPLFYFLDADKIIFASELKSLMAAGIPKVIDRISVLNYLQLNYIPGPYSIFENVRKLKPGHYMLFNGRNEVEERCYYSIPDSFRNSETANSDYEKAKNQLVNLLDASVQKRLIADVPLGAFLSGGIDSSVIVALASKHTKHLNTFSIGYRDEPTYDETRYAKLVANRYKTNHTVFELSNEDLYGNLYSVLDYTDEPFADSSALAVNILCMNTRKHVKVSLSGDGADEMFGGYNKHRAEWMIRNRPLFTRTTGIVSKLLQPVQGARNSKWGNKVRQLHRYAQGANLQAAERYWRWCGYTDEADAADMINFGPLSPNYQERKNEILKHLGKAKSMNDVLLEDMHLVLQNDMLVKVDMMSMCHSLEVRVPFLDYEVVNFAFGIPDSFKIDPAQQKRILRDAFRKDLPDELFNRGKHGFEVPLLKWLQSDLKSLINDQLLSDSFIDRQGLFNKSAINKLKNQLFSSNPGEIEARMWGLIVFQYWWKKYMD